jgi:TolA-binding protein
VFAPADLDLYGNALIDAQRLDDAEKVFAKLAADYPLPPGVDPSKAPYMIQEAQATALFGSGKVLQRRGDTASAGRRFEELKKLYPWSPKILEANFGIAADLAAKKKSDEAQTLLTQIIRDQRATAELRANSMLLFAKIFEKEGKIDNAIDNYGKIAQFYTGVPAAASEGLFKAGELLEKKAAGENDPKAKAGQIERAKKFYKQVADNFASSPFAEKAAARSRALGN